MSSNHRCFYVFTFVCPRELLVQKRFSINILSDQPETTAQPVIKIFKTFARYFVVLDLKVTTALRYDYACIFNVSNRKSAAKDLQKVRTTCCPEIYPHTFHP